MKLHSQLTQCLQEEERQQQLLLKNMRYEKAVAEFSKQKFMKKHMNTGSITENINLNNNQSQMMKGERQKVENLKTNLLMVLKNKNIDFDDRTKNLSQFPLSCFDEETFEPVTNLNYLISSQFESGVELNGRCLVKYQNSFTYVYGRVYGHNPKNNKFSFRYESDSKEVKVSVPRIYICFDDQNPYKYCERVAKAFSSRISFDSHHKMVQTVRKMPTTYISKFNEDQKLRIERSVNGKQGFQQQSVNRILQEVEEGFKLAMNSIMLRRCYQQKEDLIPHQFIIDEEKRKQCPYYGLPEKNRAEKEMIVTKESTTLKEQKPLLQKFHAFCEQSLLTSKEVVLSLQAIKSECDDVTLLQLFKIELVKIYNTKETKEPYRFQHFQADHNVHNQKVLGRVKTLWVSNIRAVVEKEFRKGAVPWFNMNQKDREVYERSKTRRYFELTRLMMENTLLQLCRQSFHNYVKYIQRFIPETVEVISPMHVVSTYSDGYVIDSTRPETYERIRSKITLFETDLMKNYDDSGFGLATPAPNFMNLILNNFDKMLDELAKIPDIESKVMIELYKKNRGDRFLKVPNRFSTDQENRWIVDLHSSLKQKLEGAIEPVLKYVGQFDQFIPILKMKPDEYIKEIERQDEEQEKDIQVLKEEVLNLYRKEKELSEKMPGCIRVSIFKIHLKEMNDKLASKYNSTAKGLELLIAKKARRACKNVLEKYDEIKLKLKVKPKDIEKLMELKDYMDNIRNELGEISKEVARALSIYDVLDELRYVMPQEDLKKKYQMLMGPKEILDDTCKRKEELASKNMEFSDNLRIQQEEFKLTLEGRARTVAQFGMHSKKQQYKEIVEKVEIILDSLNKCQFEAKRINGRQQLFQKNLTDYSKVNLIQTEFMNYANYWLTLNEWLQKYSTRLLNSTLDSINPLQIQKFTQQSYDKLKDSASFFISKDLAILSQNADLLREEIDSIRDIVPVLKALKQIGGSEKNWHELSEKIECKVSHSTLTISKIKEMNLERHLNFVKEIASRTVVEEEAPVKPRNKQISKINDHLK